MNHSKFARTYHCPPPCQSMSNHQIMSNIFAMEFLQRNISGISKGINPWHQIS